jgi:nucleotide-binding universal stress UspA family protein
MGTVLVALDDSEGSERVAGFVNRFFDKTRHEVLAISVASRPVSWIPPATPHGWIYGWDSRVTTETDTARVAAAEARAGRIIADAGIAEDEAIVDVGDPAVVILEAADARDVDVIVVGSHHKGLIERLVFGSVSRDLVKESTRPLLLVP